MMLRYLVPVLLASVALPGSAGAHPGSGIVVDRHGTVYFVVAGASHLMKIRPGERARIFTADERLRVPHHLTYGRDGYIYVVSDDDGRVFRIDSAGKLQLHFNSRRARISRGSEFRVGAWGDPFAVDSAGNVYALAEPNASTLVRVSIDGAITPIAPHAQMQPLHFRTMTFGSDGALYLTDADRVWRIRGDSVQAVVPRGVSLPNPAGIAVDGDGNIYVAGFANRRVVRLGPDGRENTPPWLADREFRGPTGVALRGDTLYVLDYAPGSTAVWRVDPDDAQRVYTQSFWKWHLRRMLAGIPILFVGLLIADRYQKRRSTRRPEQASSLTAAANSSLASVSKPLP